LQALDGGRLYVSGLGWKPDRATDSYGETGRSGLNYRWIVDDYPAVAVHGYDHRLDSIPAATDPLSDGLHTVTRQFEQLSGGEGPPSRSPWTCYFHVGTCPNGVTMGVDAIHSAATTPVLAEVRHVPVLVLPGLAIFGFMVGPTDPSPPGRPVAAGS